jgi:hypothetical protein
VPALVLAAIVAVLGLVMLARSRRQVAYLPQSIGNQPRMLPDRSELPTSALSVNRTSATIGDASSTLGHATPTVGDAASTLPPQSDATWRDAPALERDRFDRGDDFDNSPTVILSELNTHVEDIPTAVDRPSLSGQPGSPIPSGPPHHATLTVSLPGQPAVTWPIGADQVIGRIEGPGVIVVKDTQVSRRHARISWEQGRFVYRDLAPTNPTLRHGQPIPNPCYLVDGDRLYVGRAELIFRA